MVWFILLNCIMSFICTSADTSGLSEETSPQSAKPFGYLVTNRTEIWKVEVNGEKHQYWRNTSSPVVDVDYHLRKNILFWIDAEKRDIHLQSLDVNSSGSYAAFKQQRNWQPVALAVDSIRDKIYVADALGMKIDLFDLYGCYHIIAVGANLTRPYDIELDPSNGYLFILDGQRIVRTDIDGSSVVVVVQRGVQSLSGFAIDSFDEKVYWLRNSDSQMMASSYSGENVLSIETSKTSGSLTWSKFSLFNCKLFYAGDYVLYKSQCRDDRLGSERQTVYEKNPIPVIKILHAPNYVSDASPCDNDNGGCQHVCISSSKNMNQSRVLRQCACNVGWKLDRNLKNCTRVRDFLMYAQTNVMKTYLLDNCTFCEPFAPIVAEKKLILDFDFNYNDNYLYYIVTRSLKRDAIYRVRLNESEPEIFSIGEHEQYQSIAVDWITNGIYSADSLKGTLNVMSAKNKSQRSVLLRNLQQPEDIVIHPSRGLIFFFQSNGTDQVLSKVNNDGTELRIFFDLPLKRHCGFAIDFEDEQIYWFEWSSRFISNSDFDVSKIQNLESTFSKHVYAMFIHGKWAYVATSTSRGLWRFNKKTGRQSEMLIPDFTNKITKVKIFSPKTKRIDQRHPCLANKDEPSSKNDSIPSRDGNTASLAGVCANID